MSTDKSNHRRCSSRNGVLRNFAKFLGIHLYQILFFNKVVACNFIKKWPWHRCFPVNFVKFLRTPFYKTPPGDCFCTENQWGSIYIIYSFIIVAKKIKWILKSRRSCQMKKMTDDLTKNHILSLYVLLDCLFLFSGWHVCVA